MGLGLGLGLGVGLGIRLATPNPTPNLVRDLHGDATLLLVADAGGAVGAEQGLEHLLRDLGDGEG